MIQYLTWLNSRPTQIAILLLLIGSVGMGLQQGAENHGQLERVHQYDVNTVAGITETMFGPATHAARYGDAGEGGMAAVRGVRSVTGPLNDIVVGSMVRAMGFGYEHPKVARGLASAFQSALLYLMALITFKQYKRARGREYQTP